MTMMLMKTPHSFFASGLCAMTLAACHDQAPTPAKTAPQREAINVKTTPVGMASWDHSVTIVGTLYPKDSATIAAEVDGLVQKTTVEFGDRVTAGQTLAVIDNSTYKADLQRELGNLARADANLTNARQNLIRSKGLQKTGAVAASELDLATAQSAQWEAEVKAVNASVGMVELNIARSTIKAPFDGAIADRIATQGDYVKIGAPMFKVVNDKVLKFIFEVPEKHASFVKKELSITFGVDNYPGEVFSGSVYLISPQVNTATRAFNVGALVQNPDLRLKASSFARGELVLELGVPTAVVPQDSIISYAGVTKVFVIENGTAHGLIVRTGRARDGLQEILEGLKDGEQVVVSGQSKLVDGAPVAVQTGATGNNPKP